MWIILAAAAIVATAINLIVSFRGREPKWFRFSGLALTALTMCAFYSAEASRALSEDWAGIADIMPTMSKILWVCVIASIVLNGVTLFKKSERN